MGKGASLLWTNPKQKRGKEDEEDEVKVVKDVKEPKEQKPKEKPRTNKKKSGSDESILTTPKTPAKKSRKTAVKAETAADDKVSSKKKSTGKRARTKSETVVKDEVDAEFVDHESPTKKQRRIRLRAQTPVNYNENGIAADQFDEDIFDARSPSDGSRGSADGTYGSQQSNSMVSGSAESVPSLDVLHAF